MAQNNQEDTDIRIVNVPQQIFVRYFTAILIDLTVLNLFDEFWDMVIIESFSISLLAAILLQVLLKITIKIEHHVGSYFKKKTLRLLSAWTILFISKFIILGAINFIFGDDVQFIGPLHGIVSFIVVVTGMLVAELIIVKINNSLGD